MATKAEVFASAIELCNENGASETLIEGLTKLLEPKKGGAQFALEDIAVVVDGVVTHILDSVAKLWVPVTNDEGEFNFYEKPDTELGYSRFSRASEKARKDSEKTFKASKEAIMSDMLEGNIDNVEAKDLMAAADEARAALEFPEDLGTEERPAA